MEKEELLKNIVEYCKAKKIKGSFNSECDNHLVSFEITDSKLYKCECCGFETYSKSIYDNHIREDKTGEPK